MKNILVILVGLVVSLTTLNTTYGQLSKEEKKEWKQKYKAYKQDLEAFKNLVEENSTLKSQVNSSKGQVSSLQSRIADKDAQISDLQGQLSGMESQVNSAKAAQRRAEEAMAAKPAVAASGDWDKGIVFRVQIGAFAKASADAEGRAALEAEEMVEECVAHALPFAAVVATGRRSSSHSVWKVPGLSVRS